MLHKCPEPQTVRHQLTYLTVSAQDDQHDGTSLLYANTELYWAEQFSSFMQCM